MNRATLKNNTFQTINLPELTRVPTMITEDEKKYLYWLARDHVSGDGAVVEIGTWYGCSAGYLGAGLRDSGKNIPFHCFDRFELQGIEIRKARQQGFTVQDSQEGEDILPMAQNHLTPIYPIKLKKTYAADIRWEGGLVELLHLDAPKRWSDILHVMETFLPFLIPQKSILVLQDFGMPRAYALPLIFGALSDYFELINIPSEYSTMAVFLYNPVSPEKLNSQKLNIDDWSSEYAQKIWDQIGVCYTNSSQKSFFNFGLALYFYRNGHKELAIKIAQENKPLLFPEKAILLEKRLSTALWRAAFK